MLQTMRGKVGKILTILFAAAFVAWMVLELGMESSGGASLQAGEIGTVNGRPVLFQSYQLAYQELYQQARQETGGELSAEQQRALDDRAWDRVVNEMLLQQAMQRLSIRASDAEVREAALLNPHPSLIQNELFQTEGSFDLRKYQEFLTGPTANRDILLQLEDYYRQAVPQAKLIRQVTAGTYVSDAQLWRAWQDRNETATVEYVPLEVSRLVPGDVQVSAAEVRRYYDEHRDEFRRPATARFTFAVLSKEVTAADSVAVLARVNAVLAELSGGADFAEVAIRESADPGSSAQGGDLGLFGRGQMVPAFEEAAFATPVGEISDPVLTPFGYHIIRVEGREGDQLRARHILIPIEKSDETLDRLYTRADSLEDVALAATLERAARATGATLRSGVTVSTAVPYVPGIGSALEALEWAEDEAESGTAVGKVSDLLETEEAFYAARVESFTPEGSVPLAEATPQIRRQLTLEKKQARAAEIGMQMVAAVRAGQPLQQVAAARGLTVQQTGPFTRVQPNPALGQANAAIGAAFGVKVGQVSDVMKTPAGLFIIRPVARVEADRAAWEAQKQAQRALMTSQLQQEAFARYLASLRARAKIVDNRKEALQPAERPR